MSSMIYYEKDLQNIPSIELKNIIINEGKHFPLKRTLKFLTTLILLFITSMSLGSDYENEHLTSGYIKYIITALFVMYCIGLTIFEARTLKRIH